MRPRLALAAAALAAALAAAPPSTAGGVPGHAEAVVRTLTVQIEGTGAGGVTSSRKGDDGDAITCSRANGTSGGDCADTFTFRAVGPEIVLTAAAASGSAFEGWRVEPSIAILAACGAETTCKVIPSHSDVVVTAVFAATATSYPLTVQKAGTGEGTVSSTTAGVSCGSDCSEAYAPGTSVTLTADPARGSSFTGWSGACTGSGACTVTLSEARVVTATFTREEAAAQVTTVAVARRGGPPNAKRRLTVALSAQEPVDVVVALLRNGLVKWSRTTRDVATGDTSLRFSLRNTLAAGRYELRVTFVDDARARAVFLVPLRLPRP